MYFIIIIIIIIIVIIILYNNILYYYYYYYYYYNNNDIVVFWIFWILWLGIGMEILNKTTKMALTKRKKIKAKSASRSKKISEAAANRWYITTSIRTLKGEKEAEWRKPLDYGKQTEEKAFEVYKATCKGDYVRNSGLRVSHG